MKLADLLPLRGLRAWIVLILVGGLVQASFWLLSAQLQRLPYPPKMLEANMIRKAQVLPLPEVAAPPQLTPVAAGVPLVKLPYVPSEKLRDLCVKGTPGKAVRVHFERELPSPDGQALLILFAADNVAPYLNGRLLAPPRGKFDARPSRDGRQAWLLPLPPQGVQAGTNGFDLLVAHNGCLPMVTNVLVGDYAKLSRVYGKAQNVRMDVPMLAIWLSLFVGLAVALLLPIAQDRQLILSFAVMMLCLAARSYYPMWSDWRFDQAGFAAIGGLVAILNGATITYFIHLLASRQRRIEGWLILGITTLHLLVLAVAWQAGWTAVLVYLDAWYLFFAALYAAVVLLLWFARDPLPALWPVTIFGIYVGMTVWTQAYSWLLIPMTFNTRHLVPFYLASGLGVMMLYRGYSLYRAAEAARASLAEQVAEKEVEIRDSYLKLREQERQNAIQNERQRLISDMHDGVGSQLMSLLMTVRNKAYEPDSLPQAVQAIIDDMRLIVDSMDSAGATLAEALEAFRQRVLSRLRLGSLASGAIEVGWHNELPADQELLRPRDVLQIYRFLQEAVTNVIKHARASRIDMHFALVDDGNVLSIVVADDGCGMAEDFGLGHGMASMRRRIGQIGGTLQVAANNPQGVILTARITLNPLDS